jgi:hypothetical protein
LTLSERETLVIGSNGGQCSPESALSVTPYRRRNIPQKPFRALRVPDLTVISAREYSAALMVLLDGFQQP